MDIKDVMKIRENHQEECFYIKTMKGEYFGFISGVDFFKSFISIITISSGRHESVKISLEDIERMQPFTFEMITKAMEETSVPSSEEPWGAEQEALQCSEKKYDGTEDEPCSGHVQVGSCEDETSQKNANLDIFQSVLKKGDEHIRAVKSELLCANELEQALIRGEKEKALELLRDSRNDAFGYSPNEWETIKSRIQNPKSVATWNTRDDIQQAQRLYLTLNAIHGIAEHFYTKLLFKNPTKGVICTLFQLYITTKNHPALIYLFNKHEKILITSIDHIMQYAVALYEEGLLEEFKKACDKYPVLLTNGTSQAKISSLIASVTNPTVNENESFVRDYEKFMEIYRKESVDYPEPNAFEDAVINADREECARQAGLFENKDERDIIIGKVESGNVNWKEDSYATAMRLRWLQGNKNHQVEKYLVKALEENNGQAAYPLLSIYSEEGRRDLFLALAEAYPSAISGFRQVTAYASFLLDNGKFEAAISIFRHSPEMLMLHGMRERLLQAAKNIEDEDAEAYLENVTPEIFGFPEPNELEHAVIEADVEKVISLLSEPDILSGMGYTDEQCASLVKKADGNFWVNGRQVSQIAQRLIQLQENIHRQAEKFLWQALSFKTMRKKAMQFLMPILVKERRLLLVDQLYAAYPDEAKSLSNYLNTKLEILVYKGDEEGALDVLIENPKLVGNEVEKWRDMAERLGRMDVVEMLDNLPLEPNEFELAVIEESSVLHSLAENKERLLDLGYDVGEIAAISQVARAGNYMHGSDEHAVGTRLYQFQKNKNGQALRFFEMSKDPRSYSNCFQMYCEDDRWEKAYDYVKHHPDVLRRDLMPGWFDTLYYTGHYSAFIEDTNQYGSSFSNRQSMQHAIALLRTEHELDEEITQILLDMRCNDLELWNELLNELFDRGVDNRLVVTLLDRQIRKQIVTTPIKMLDVMVSLKGKLCSDENRLLQLLSLAKEESAGDFVMYCNLRGWSGEVAPVEDAMAWLSELLSEHVSYYHARKIFVENLLMLFPKDGDRIRMAFLSFLLENGSTEQNADDAVLLFNELHEQLQDEIFSAVLESELLVFPALWDTVIGFGFRNDRQSDLTEMTSKKKVPMELEFEILRGINRTREQSLRLLELCRELAEKDSEKDLNITAYTVFIELGRIKEARLMELLMNDRPRERMKLPESRLCAAEDRVFDCFAALMQEPVGNADLIEFWKYVVNIQESDRLFAETLTYRDSILSAAENDILCRLLLSNPQENTYWESFIKFNPDLDGEVAARARFWRSRFTGQGWDDCLNYVEHLNYADLEAELALQLMLDHKDNIILVRMAQRVICRLLATGFFADGKHHREAEAVLKESARSIKLFGRAEPKWRVLELLRGISVQADLEEHLIELIPEFLLQGVDGKNGQGYALLAQVLKKGKPELASSLSERLKASGCTSPFAELMQKICEEVMQAPERMESGEISDILDFVEETGGNSPNIGLYMDYLIECIRQESGERGLSVLLRLKKYFPEDPVIDEMIYYLCHFVEDETERYQRLYISLCRYASGILNVDSAVFMSVCREMIAAYWLLKLEGISLDELHVPEAQRNPVQYFRDHCRESECNKYFDKTAAQKKINDFYEDCKSLCESQSGNNRLLKVALYGIASQNWRPFLEYAVNHVEPQYTYEYKIFFKANPISLFRSIAYEYLSAIKMDDSVKMEWLRVFSAHLSISKKWLGYLEQKDPHIFLHRFVLLMPLEIEKVPYKLFIDIRKEPLEDIVAFFKLMEPFKDMWKKIVQHNGHIYNIEDEVEDDSDIGYEIDKEYRSDRLYDHPWENMRRCIMFLPLDKAVSVYEEISRYVNDGRCYVNLYFKLAMDLFRQGNDAVTFAFLSKFKPFKPPVKLMQNEKFIRGLRICYVKSMRRLSGIFSNNDERINKIKTAKTGKLINTVAQLLISDRADEYGRLLQYLDSEQKKIAECVWCCMAGQPSTALRIADALPEEDEAGNLVRAIARNYLRRFSTDILYNEKKKSKLGLLDASILEGYKYIFDTVKYSGMPELFILSVKFGLRKVNTTIRPEWVYTPMQDGKEKKRSSVSDSYEVGTKKLVPVHEAVTDVSLSEEVGEIWEIFNLPYIKDSVKEISLEENETLDFLVEQLRKVPRTEYDERDELFSKMFSVLAELSEQNDSLSQFEYDIGIAGLEMGMNRFHLIMSEANGDMLPEAMETFYQAVSCIGKAKKEIPSELVSDIMSQQRVILLHYQSLREAAEENRKTRNERRQLCHILDDKKMGDSLANYFDILDEADSILKMSADDEEKANKLADLQNKLNKAFVVPGSEWRQISRKLYLDIDSDVRRLKNKPDLSVKIYNEECQNDSRIYGAVCNRGGKSACGVYLHVKLGGGIIEKVYRLKELKSSEEVPFSVIIPNSDEDTVEYHIYATCKADEGENYISNICDGNIRIEEPDEDYEDEFFIPKFRDDIPAMDEGTDKFIGRRQEIRKMTHLYLGSRKVSKPDFSKIPSCMLYGLRRSGKTSILKKVQKIMGERGDILLCDIDAQKFGKDAVIQQVFINEPLKILMEHLEQDEPTEEDRETYEKARNFRDEWSDIRIETNFGCLTDFYRRYAKLCAPFNLVVSVDEVEKVFEGAEQLSIPDDVFFGTLRSILQQCNDSVHFLFCGSDYLTNYIINGKLSQVFQNIEKCHVKGMSRQDTMEIINQLPHVPGSSIKFYEGVEDLVWKYTGGMVWHVKLLMNLIADRLQNDLRAVVYPSDVIEELNRLVNDPDKFRDLEVACSDDERNVLTKLAICQSSYNEPVPFDSLRGVLPEYGVDRLRDALEKLEKRTLIKLSEDEENRGCYSMFTEIYRLRKREDNVSTFVLQRNFENSDAFGEE